MPARPSIHRARPRRPPAPARKRPSPIRNRPSPARGDVRAAARATASSVYRDAILQAAEDVFTERGYVAAKMIDVARRAGMSVGALYRHFDSKEAIFESLVRRASDRFVDELQM